VGSGAGLRQIRGKTVDFGASDAPLKDEELATDGLIQFPMVIGGVVPVVNVKGDRAGQVEIERPRSSATSISARSRVGNDPAIVALNSGLTLPDAKIAVVRRADGPAPVFSSPTNLSKTNAEWKEKGR